MNLKEYFDNTEGYGILSTANSKGEVNAAVYSRPNVMEDGSLAVIMNNRLSHENIKQNPNAHYLFIENSSGIKGKRLTLSFLHEEQDSELLFQLCKRCHPATLEPDSKTRFLVFFKVEKELPLIGSSVS